MELKLSETEQELFRRIVKIETALNELRVDLNFKLHRAAANIDKTILILEGIKNEHNQ